MRSRPVIRLRLRLAGRRRTVWVGDRSELFAFADIFLGGEYADVTGTDPDVIVDLGANVGAATLYFHSRFPRARIYAIEPDPGTVRRLQRNVGDLANVVVVECAVAARSGRATFEPAARSSASRLVTADVAGPAMEVDAYSFDDLLERLGLDHVGLLKMDIEGAEFCVLDQASRLRDVDEIVGELHFDHADARPNARYWLESVGRGAGLDVVHHGPVFRLRRSSGAQVQQPVQRLDRPSPRERKSGETMRFGLASGTPYEKPGEVS